MGGVENIQQFDPNKQHVSHAERSVSGGGRAINQTTPSTSQLISSTGYSTAVQNAASPWPACLSPQAEPERSPADPELVLANVNLIVIESKDQALAQEVDQYATSTGKLTQTSVGSDEFENSFGVLPVDNLLASYYTGIQQDTYTHGLDDVQAGEGDGLVWNQDTPADTFTANEPASNISLIALHLPFQDRKTNEEYSKAYLAGHDAFASMMREYA